MTLENPSKDSGERLEFGYDKAPRTGLEAARAIPPEMQDALARMLLQFASEVQPVIQLTAEEEFSFEASLAQADRGEFATDEQVRAIWAKPGL